MRPEIVRHLRCPVCHAPLGLAGADARAPLVCAQGHSFDQAKQGYAQLTAGPLAHVGDSAAMIAARAAFLGRGHYRFITEALAAGSAAGPAAPFVVDVGAGTGAHLAGVLDARPDATGLATDVSKYAARVAARAHPRGGAIVCDAWRELPVADASAGVLLNVFAPRPGPEFARVLAPDGLLLVITPEPGHLAQLIEPLGMLRVDPAKGDRMRSALGADFTETDRALLRHEMALSHADVAALAGMGPSAFHTAPDALAARIAALGSAPVRTTATVALTTFRRAR